MKKLENLENPRSVRIFCQHCICFLRRAEPRAWDAKSIYSADKKSGLRVGFPNFSVSSIFQFSVFLRFIKSQNSKPLTLLLILSPLVDLIKNDTLTPWHLLRRRQERQRTRLQQRMKNTHSNHMLEASEIFQARWIHHTSVAGAS